MGVSLKSQKCPPPGGWLDAFTGVRKRSQFVRCRLRHVFFEVAVKLVACGCFLWCAYILGIRATAFCTEAIPRFFASILPSAWRGVSDWWNDNGGLSSKKLVSGVVTAAAATGDWLYRYVLPHRTPNDVYVEWFSVAPMTTLFFTLLFVLAFARFAKEEYHLRFVLKEKDPAAYEAELKKRKRDRECVNCWCHCLFVAPFTVVLFPTLRSIPNGLRKVFLCLSYTAMSFGGMLFKGFVHVGPSLLLVTGYAKGFSVMSRCVGVISAKLTDEGGGGEDEGSTRGGGGEDEGRTWRGRGEDEGRTTGGGGEEEGWRRGGRGEEIKDVAPTRASPALIPTAYGGRPRLACLEHSFRGPVLDSGPRAGVTSRGPGVRVCRVSSVAAVARRDSGSGGCRKHVESGPEFFQRKQKLCANVGARCVRISQAHYSLSRTAIGFVCSPSAGCNLGVVDGPAPRGRRHGLSAVGLRFTTSGRTKLGLLHGYIAECYWCLCLRRLAHYGAMLGGVGRFSGAISRAVCGVLANSTRFVRTVWASGVGCGGVVVSGSGPHFVVGRGDFDSAVSLKKYYRSR